MHLVKARCCVLVPIYWNSSRKKVESVPELMHSEGYGCRNSHHRTRTKNIKKNI